MLKILPIYFQKLMLEMYIRELRKILKSKLMLKLFLLKLFPFSSTAAVVDVVVFVAVTVTAAVVVVVVGLVTLLQDEFVAQVGSMNADRLKIKIRILLCSVVYFSTVLFETRPLKLSNYRNVGYRVTRALMCQV